MSPKKSKSDLETENIHLRAEIGYLKKATASEGITRVLVGLIQWGGISAIAYWIYRSIEVLAGRTTLADVGVQFFANISVSVALAWTVGISGCVYGWRQRTLRRDTVERMQRRNQNLEAMLDRNRTSSGLTARGDTRQEDRV